MVGDARLAGGGGARSSTRCGRRCWSSSSTTSSPARRSPGCTPTPRPSTPGSPPAWRSWSPRRSTRLALRRSWPSRRPARRAGGRWSRHRRDPAGDGPTQVLADGSVAFVADVPALGIGAGRRARESDDEVVVDRSLPGQPTSDSWPGTTRARWSSVRVPGPRPRAAGAGPAGAAGAGARPPGGVRRVGPGELDPAAGRSRSPTATRSTVVDHGPLVGAVRVRATRRAVDVHDDVPAHGRLDPPRPRHRRSTGTMTSTCCRWPSRSTSTPTRPCCDIQLGHVRRPTHASSSWDAAKFEVCAHRFVDLAEPSFGVAVLNDGRYGHAVQGDAVRVSLLRARQVPGPDRRPRPPPRDAGAAASRPRTARRAGGGRGAEPPAASGRPAVGRPCRRRRSCRSISPGVEVDAVKGADDGSGDLIVRLHEAVGDRASVELRTAGAIGRGWRCSLLEDREEELPVAGGAVSVRLRPFELVTLRLQSTG